MYEIRLVAQQTQRHEQVQLLGMQCPFCRCLMKTERRQETEVLLLLGEATKYSMCPHCLGPMGSGPYTKTWMRRWDKKVEQLRQVVSRETK